VAEFDYKARDKFGKLATGAIDADSSEIVGTKLKQMGYTPVYVRPKRKPSGAVKLLAKFSKMKQSDLNMFTKQLATLQRAGMPLLTSLTSIKNQTQSEVLGKALTAIIQDMEGGSHLSEALSKHPAVFNELYVSMVKAGETGGMLDEILERLVILCGHEEDQKSKVKMATRYPILVVVSLLIGFLTLTLFVIPKFVKVFSQFDTNLPLPTVILIWINKAMVDFWWLILIAIIGCFFGFRRYIKTEKGRLWWDGLSLKVPVFGALFTNITMSRFTRVTGTLVRSGVPILQILSLVSKGVGNLVIGRTIENIGDSVSEGKGMSEPMKVSTMFPPIVVQMVAAGETTGKLDELLLFVSDYYDSLVDYTIKNLTSLIEPILIFILGLGILFVALGIFLPMWNLMQLFH